MTARPERISSVDSTATFLPEGFHLLDESLLRPTFPIDVVYTWANYADSCFADEVASYRPVETDPAISGSIRWICHDELRYSLRSLQRYAPWVNKIYIVTNGQRPAWLSSHPKVVLVEHKDILEEQYLPTFNSHVIESALHRIPGLCEHYIYFNDDIMLLRSVVPTRFFTSSGLALAFLGNVEVPNAPPQLTETATNWAAKNAQKLIREQYGAAVGRRLAHTCHPQRKSAAEESERMFACAYRTVRENRFRAISDVLVSNYLNQHVGYFTSKVLFTSAPWWYVLIRHQQAEALYEAILAQKNLPQARMTVCVNDHPKTDNQLQSPERILSTFLTKYFPEPSEFEKKSQEGGEHSYSSGLATISNGSDPR